MSKLIDLTGQKFGRLTVIERADNKISGGQTKTTWLCKCDCGNTVIVCTQELRRGDTRSCGCFAKEEMLKRFKTHGKRNTRLYKIWLDMKARCSNPNEINYPNYGGRGISVDSVWRDNFEEFYKWAMLNGYSDNLSIDRIDGSKDYSPQNCRWATRKEQANNTRRNFNIFFNGETHTLSEWSEIVGIRAGTIRERLKRFEWSVEDALTIPVGKRRKF